MTEYALFFTGIHVARSNAPIERTEIKPTTDAPQVSLESAIEHAKRAFALKKYEDAVDHYATALELMYACLCHLSRA